MRFKFALKKEIKYLCFDPGTANFAYSVIVNNIVVNNGFIRATVKQNNKECRDGFKKELIALINKEKPSIVTMERFITRGFQAHLAELVGVMCGIVDYCCFAHNIEFTTLTATQWKNSIKKILDLKELYKKAKKEYKIPPHPIDCMLMGRYISNGNKFVEEDIKWIHENLKRVKNNG